MLHAAHLSAEEVQHVDLIEASPLGGNKQVELRRKHRQLRFDIFGNNLHGGVQAQMSKLIFHTLYGIFAVTA